MATRAPKQASMCCVEIGFDSFLMTVDDGMRVIKLMQNAIQCERTYATGYVYVPSDEPVKLEMKIVKPSQIVTRSKLSTLLLENE